MPECKRNVILSAVQPDARERAGAPAARRKAVQDSALELLTEAGRRGSDLAVLPEALNVYASGARAEAGREALRPLRAIPVVRRAAALARRFRMNVAVSVLCLDEGGLPRNACVFLDRRGAIAGRYEKVHPTRGERDRWGIVPGERFAPVALDFGQVGAFICHDMSFQESARCQRLAGAELLVWPHVQSAWGDIVWDITLRSRAVDNEVPLVSSCFSVRGELFQDLVLLGHAFPPKADDSGGQNVEGPRAGDPELREAPGYERGRRRTEQPNRDDQEKGMRLS